jgi:hypothetical protein
MSIVFSGIEVGHLLTETVPATTLMRVLKLSYVRMSSVNWIKYPFDAWNAVLLPPASLYKGNLKEIKPKEERKSNRSESHRVHLI